MEVQRITGQRVAGEVQQGAAPSTGDVCLPSLDPSSPASTPQEPLQT